MKMQLTIYLTLLMTSFILLINCFSAKAQSWKYNFDEAKHIARENKKRILMVFHRSDWCLACSEMEKNILSSEVFKTYSETHLTMLKVDFPKQKRNALSIIQEIHNKHLAERYNKQGEFPYMVVVDEKGSVLGSMGYSSNQPDEYIQKIHTMLK